MKLNRKEKFRYRLIAEGAVIGLVTGALISMFRLMLTGADQLRDIMVIYAGGGAVHVLICAAILTVIAVLVTILLVYEPDISGSGIPQVEAELRGQKDMDWR